MTKDYEKLSLTEFKRNTAKYLKKIRNSRRPAFLTVNGRVELIVQDARAYQELLDRSERAETTVALRQGIEQFNRGEGREARDAFNDLRQKHGILR
jgi:PHD/YefM family antitoxin component YafN of YafNO toxin-antitoxin module